MSARQPLLFLLAVCSVLAAPAGAQNLAAADRSGADLVQSAPPGARMASGEPAAGGSGLKTTVALRGAPAPALRLGRATTVTAAGNVLVLADGMVIDARMAQVPPPAPGFQYEP